MIGGLVHDLRDLLRRPRGVRAENRLKLLRVIMAKAGSQTYLSNRAELSTGAVSDAVDGLVEAGIVRRRPEGRERVVEMVPTTGVAVGIELGFQYSVIVARTVDQPFDQARAKTCHVGAARASEAWLDEVTDSILELVAEADGDERQIATIGLGVPRIVNPRDATFTPPRLFPWENIESPSKLLEQRLRARLPAGTRLPRVLLDNDATLGALGESTYAFPKIESLVNVKASTGIGAGIIIGGAVFRGARGVAGEIGHMVVDPGGKFCSCGGRGCLETVVGADALVEQAKTVVGRRPMLTLNSLEDLVAAANRGNAVCVRVLREAGIRIGTALGNICNILNPQVIVIGGALGRADAVGFVLGPCADAIKQSAMRAAYEEEFQIVPSGLEHAAAHGALVLGLLGTTY